MPWFLRQEYMVVYSLEDVEQMVYKRMRRLVALTIVVFTLSGMLSVAAANQSSELHAKVKRASAALRDMQATMVVTSISKSNAEEINPAFSEVGQFQKATVYYKAPDKFRADGVAKGMAVAYVVDGTKLQIVVPGLLKRVEDVSTKAGKQRTTLDMGFITDVIWRDNNVTHLGSEGGILRLKLDPKLDKTRRYELIWVDPSNLRLVKRQRHNSAGQLRATYVYGDFKTVGRLPVAQQARIFAPDGGFVGAVEYQDVKVNTGLKNSLFILVK